MLPLRLPTEKIVVHPEEAAVPGAEVKKWATLAYLRHRENLPVGPGPAFIKLDLSET